MILEGRDGVVTIAGEDGIGRAIEIAYTDGAFVLDEPARDPVPRPLTYAGSIAFAVTKVRISRWLRRAMAWPPRPWTNPPRRTFGARRRRALVRPCR